MLFGVFTFWVTAWIYWLLPRIWGVEMHSNSLARWHYWLSMLGIAIMQIDLLAAGLVQGMMWKGMSPFIESVTASMPFWWTRTFTGIMILVGESCFLVNVYLTWTEAKKQKAASAPVGGEIAYEVH